MNSSIQSVCPFCPNITLDPLGHHAVSHADMVGMLSSDTIACETSLPSFVAVLTSVRVEVGQGLLRVQSNSHPADVLVSA